MQIGRSAAEAVAPAELTWAVDNGVQSAQGACVMNH